MGRVRGHGAGLGFVLQFVPGTGCTSSAIVISVLGFVRKQEGTHTGASSLYMALFAVSHRVPPSGASFAQSRAYPAVPSIASTLPAPECDVHVNGQLATILEVMLGACYDPSGKEC